MKINIILWIIALTIVSLCTRFVYTTARNIEMTNMPKQDYTGKGWEPEPTTTKFTIPENPKSKSVPGNQCLKFGEDLIC